MRATKLVISIKNLTYKDSLKRLKLPTLKYRRIRGDMIEVYKILTNKYEISSYTILLLFYRYKFTHNMSEFVHRKAAR